MTIKDRGIQAAIKSVLDGTKAEVTLNDGAEAKGAGSLKLVVRRTGRGCFALWFATWMADGQRQKKQIGRYPDVSLQDARQKFRTEYAQLLKAGKNPRLAAPIVSPTVQALFTAYTDHLEADGRRTVKEIRRVLLNGGDACADGLGRHRMAGDISPADVAAYLALAFNRGARRQADIQRTCMAAAFNWGIRSTHDYRTATRGDWGIPFNPVTMVPKDAGANRPGNRNLSAVELAGLWAGMSAGRFTLEVEGAVKLLICCGQRVRETLRADGADFDLDAGLWTMPAHKTKGGKPHEIPLPSQAVAVVRELVAHHGAGPLFPSRQGASTAYIMDTSLNQACRRWLKEAGVKPFTTKDLRRTWKSRAGDGALISREMRDMIQQHARSDTGSKNYDRAVYLPQMREAMAKLEAWLSEVLEPKQLRNKLAA